MLFNSKEFLLFFLPVVLCIYWAMNKGRLKTQNLFLLIASYYFYSWWDWRFVFLLLLSTVIDYSFGIKIHSSESHKKLFLWFSVFSNLAILGFFKYYNFFADSFSDLVHVFGMTAHPYVLQVALPVGISFYTFHGMSYVFDIYNGKIKPTSDFVDYGLFVCFFPLLVAGPIERATHLLPQVKKRRVFDAGQSMDGVKMMLWGFFKKVVIADSIAPVVNNIFDNYQQYSGATLIFGAILFSIQIYGDFSGYTDIALGTAKLFGFELLTNFRFPYFSRNIAEFWKRWHISLSSWFREYLYIPLGGSRRGKAIAVRNTFIIFLVSGFWHGANWTFIIWGLFHALLFLPLLLLNLTKKNRSEDIGGDRLFPGGKEFGQMMLTFSLVTIGWIFFRAPDISSAFSYIGRIVSDFNLVIDPKVIYGFDIAMIAILVVYDYMLLKKLVLPRFALFVFHVFITIAIFGSFIEDRFANQFIYFQF
jgi:alginate O-acetyltransferase complex protein AlgI